MISSERCFIIAEAGVNHNGALELAIELVNAAKESGADAVKFQTFKAERLVVADAPMAEYQKENTGKTESQLDMLRRLELPDEWHVTLRDYCAGKGIQFLSTPFDEQSADFLQRLGMPLFKTPSGELTNLQFLAHIAQYGKPMIVSTGMANLGEVEAAVQCIRQFGTPPLVLLHCVSSYPAAPADVNLRAIHTLGAAFGVPVGLSDHTLGIEIGLAAVALGARVIEKHITLDCSMPGPDHRASLEPRNFKAMVHGIRNIEAAMGTGRKEPTPAEANTAAVARKSLAAAHDLPVGTQIAQTHITTRRPGTGLAPALLPHVIGMRTRVDVKAGALLSFEDLLA